MIKFNLNAIIMPKLYFIAVSEDASIICHIPRKDFDARHGRGRAQALTMSGKIARFQCLTFDNTREFGPCTGDADWSINGYALCHLWASIAGNKPERMASDKDIDLLFDRDADRHAAGEWIDNVGQHVINGTSPPKDRPDLMGYFKGAMTKDPHLAKLHTGRA